MGATLCVCVCVFCNLGGEGSNGPILVFSYEVLELKGK